MKLFFACFKEVNVTGGVDRVSQVSVLPLGQVILLHGPGLHLLGH